MANSILQGVVSQPVDLAGAFSRGQQMYNSNQNAQLDQQRAKQDISEVDYQKNVRKLQIANRLAKQAIGLPQEARAKLMQDYSGALLSVGFTPEDLARTPLDDAGLQNLIAQTDSVIQAGAPQQTQQGSQFGAQETLKDESGNIFFATSRRNPNTGEMTGVVAAADGSDAKPVGRLSVAGSYGQTAQERVGQVGAEASARTQSEINARVRGGGVAQEVEALGAGRGKNAAEAEGAAGKVEKTSKNLLANIEQARSLLPKATGSGVGALVDAGGRFIGVSTEQSKASSQLETLAGWMVSNIPRMEGPQSNFDVENYKTMAAKVGNSAIPIAERLAALDVLEQLQLKYSEINRNDLNPNGTPQQNRRASDKKPAEDGAVDWSTLP